MDLRQKPPCMYTHEVLNELKISMNQWRDMRRNGKAPTPAWRGRNGEWVYKTSDIYRFFGHTSDVEDNDPIMQGIDRLGHP
jgi:hypothetical protein